VKVFFYFLFCLFLAIPSTFLGQGQMPIARAGVLTCRLDPNVPLQLKNSASAAWRIARAQFPDAPIGIEINPAGPSNSLAIFLVRDSLEGTDPCHPGEPGDGDGSIREFDSQTVAGICHARGGTVICSSEAIKAVLKAEKFNFSRDVSPSLAYLFAHEFGHVLLRHPGAFQEGINVVRLSTVRRDNIAQLSASCERDPEQLAREEAADKFAFKALKTLFANPPFRAPKEKPEDSVINNSELVYWAGKGISAWASQYYGSSNIDPFPKPKDMCEIVSYNRGVVVVPVYGGSHPLPWNRLASIVNFEGEYVKSARIATHRSLDNGEDAFQGMNRLQDNLLAQAFTVAADRFCQRVLALDNGSLDCDHLPPPSERDDALELSTPASRAALFPIYFSVKGPYHEVISAPSAFTFSLSSYNSAPTEELALEEGRKMASIYDAFFDQLDKYLKSNGGYWLYERHTPVETKFNGFAGEFMSSVEAHGIVRVNAKFKQSAIPAMSAMKRWGRVDDVHVERWEQSTHVVVIHFFLPQTKGANEKSQRVLTRPLALDEIFDLNAAREGRPASPATFFRDLLPFLSSRLSAKFGLLYTLDEGGSSDDVFYITAGKLGDNFFLPKDWEPLTGSTAARVTHDGDLARAVARVWINNNDEEDAASIFGGEP
jgi:hypothetical protein